MIKFGITGGIGSGKSFVSKLLKQYGIPVFDCDSEAKKLTNTHPVIRERLVRLLGPEVYTADGLNKPVLAAYLFASKEHAERVNAIIHPCVKDAFCEWALQRCEEGNSVVAMESAILYESGFHTLVDKVMMVYAPLDVRCERVIARDHTTIEAVKKRMASQMPDEQKCKMADFVVKNDGTLSLDVQLDNVFSCLKGIKENK